MSKYSAGKEVLSLCGKCKLTLAHTIVSMKDTKTIGKVECRTCKGTHAYKDPAASTKKVKTKATPRTRAKSIPVNEMWTNEMAKASGKARIYSIREKFEAGEILDHKKFGAGIVQNQVDGKIEVLFQHEVKTLVHNL